MISPARKPPAAPFVARSVAPCRNHPADLQDLETLDSAVPLLHRGRLPETLGATLQRRVERLPEPFEPAFAARLAATILAEPAFARVLRAVLSQGRMRG